ncbi:MAG: hypothetical protein ACQER1_08000 [Armatimonadota bacterium]
MTPAGLIVVQALMTELAFLAAAAWVWRALMRLKVNGPCRLAIGLLVTMRLGRAVSMMSAGGLSSLDYAWLVEVVFSFVFVYTLYHVGALIAMLRTAGATATNGSRPLLQGGPRP